MNMTIYFIGHLPPPINGFSSINFRIKELLEKVTDVKVFDNSKSIISVCFFFTKMLFLRKPNSMYLALSGGLRQFFDILFIFYSRIFRIKLFIHHHSFSYLNNFNIVTFFILFLSKNSNHIFLCEEMASLISRNYKLKIKNYDILSNSAFIDKVTSKNNIDINTINPLRIGYISNISEEKGIYDFINII